MHKFYRFRRASVLNFARLDSAVGFWQGPVQFLVDVLCTDLITFILYDDDDDDDDDHDEDDDDDGGDDDDVLLDA
eukprot:2314159-Amphidinium_carterae.1